MPLHNIAFFSYSRKDAEFALRLARDLRAAGASVWLDQLDIVAGQRWDRAVEAALEQCDKLLVILTPNSVESDNVMDEVSHALEGGKRIIPILAGDCQVPFRLRRLQHLDFRQDYHGRLPELLRVFSLGQAPPAPPALPQHPGAAPQKRAWIWPRILVVSVLAGAGFGIYKIVPLGGTAPSPSGAVSEAQPTGSPAAKPGAVIPPVGPPLVSRAGLTYIRVPPGHASVGPSPGDEPFSTDIEPRDFKTDGFYMGETEVTVAAYLRFAHATQRALPSPPVIAGHVFNPDWRSENLPMVMVDWQDATDFCKWDAGRLPGEFEWEYAGRGGTTGPAYGPLHEIAWFAENSGSAHLDALHLWNVETRKVWVRYEARLVAHGATIHPVRQKKANAFGLYDMLGNAVEWTADSYREASAEKVVRGGAWGYTGLRAAMRDRYPPTMRNGYLGFRCVQ